MAWVQAFIERFAGPVKGSLAQAERVGAIFGSLLVPVGVSVLQSVDFSAGGFEVIV